MSNNIPKSDLNKIMNGVINDIMHNIRYFFTEIMNDIENEINESKQKTIIILQNNNKKSMCDGNISADNDNMIPIDLSVNSAGIMYDIYYYFMIKQMEGKLKQFILNNFEYPHSFTISVRDTLYSIKIILIKEILSYNIYTAILHKNDIIKVSSYGYSDQYKKHTSYNSIFDELFKIRESIQKKTN